MADGPIEWSAANRPFLGEPVPGDACSAMTGTRGGAVTLARFTPAGVELRVVGNVAGIVVRGDGAQKRVPPRGGIVGFRLPSLGQVDLQCARDTDGATVFVARFLASV